MLERLEGWFLCLKCGLSAIPDVSDYRHHCKKCTEMNRAALAELRERLHKRKPVSAQIDTAHLVREEREAR